MMYSNILTFIKVLIFLFNIFIIIFIYFYYYKLYSNKNKKKIYIIIILFIILIGIFFCIRILFLNNLIYATELHKVFRFGILRYLVAHSNEYGCVTYGLSNPIKNCIFLPMGMEGSLKGHDGLMYDTYSGVIKSTVQMKTYSGKSFITTNGLTNLISKWNASSKYSDHFWVDTIYKDHLTELLRRDNILLKKEYLRNKLIIINSQDYLLNEKIINDIQEKIDKNNLLLEELLIKAEPKVQAYIKLNAEAGLDPLYDDVYHRDWLQETIQNSTGIEREYAINHFKNRNAVRDAFNKTGIIKK